MDEELILLLRDYSKIKCLEKCKKIFSATGQECKDCEFARKINILYQITLKYIGEIDVE